MATTDTKVDLVINELSEEKLQELKAAGTVTPNQLWGTPDESEDDKIEKVETVYDMNSTDANLNWGYTSGIRPTTSTGVQINGKSISKYKYLNIYYARYSRTATENFGFVSRFIVDLTIVPNSSGYYAGLDTQSVPYVPFISSTTQPEFSKVYVFLDKQNGNIVFKTAAFDLNAPTTWYYDRFTFTKIEGVC